MSDQENGGVVFVSEETPPGLGGRKSVEFRGQVYDEMGEQGLFVDLIFQFHLRAELEAVLAEQGWA